MYIYYLYFSEATRYCFLSRPVPLSAVSRRGGDAASIRARILFFASYS